MEFYIIEEKAFTSNFAYGEEVEPLNYGDPYYCHTCGKPISMKKWLPPYRVVLEKPVYGDFVYGSFTEMLASEGFINAYKNSNLKGITDFHPVEIVKVKRKKKKDPEPPEYYKVQIVRSNTSIDEKASCFEREFNVGQAYCTVCQTGGVIKSFKGIHIVESTWTGEDVFYATGLPGGIIVTQDFVDFVTSNKFTNIEFIESKKYRPLWAGGPPPEL